VGFIEKIVVAQTLHDVIDHFGGQQHATEQRGLRLAAVRHLPQPPRLTVMAGRWTRLSILAGFVRLFVLGHALLLTVPHPGKSNVASDYVPTGRLRRDRRTPPRTVSGNTEKKT
jgi:hypothetical protein